MYVRNLYAKSLKRWRQYTIESLQSQEKTMTALICWRNNMLKKYFNYIREFKNETSFRQQDDEEEQEEK